MVTALQAYFNPQREGTAERSVKSLECGCQTSLAMPRLWSPESGKVRVNRQSES
jgi:hypothetical protein